MLNSLDRQQRERLRAIVEGSRPSFRQWCKASSPSYEWDWKHQTAIRRAVNRVISGQQRFLMICCPPRHGKSEQVTIRLPPYLLEQDPSQRFIIGAYNSTLAEHFSYQAQRLFAGKIDPKRNRANDWATKVDGGQQGGVRAAGVGSGVTGRGANGILIDDPVKSRAEAESAAYRARCWNWYTTDIFTRLEPGGWIILIMTRWHDDDLAGRILKSETGHLWEVLNLPATCEDPASDPLGRKLGEALCPERYDAAELGTIKQVMGEDFQALYQGRPVAAEGGIFKKHWVRRYNALPESFEAIIHSWDCANKAGQLNDWTVGTTWGVTRAGDAYLLHATQRRLEYPGLRRAAKAYADDWSPACVLIEDKGNGIALVQDMRRDTAYRIIAIEPHGDKVMRASNESTAYASGQVWHPHHTAENSGWLAPLERELFNFPNDANDDHVDSITQFLAHLSRMAISPEFASTGRRTSADLRELLNTSTEADGFTSTARRRARPRIITPG